MGVVYHSNYLIWCEVGRTDLIRALGSSYADVEREGVALAVAEVHMRYLRPARYDNIVRVTTWVAQVRSRVVRFEYEINADNGSLLATAYTTLVAVTRQATSGALPAPLRESLERVCVK